MPASDWSDRIQQTLARAEGQGTTLARAKALNGIGFMYWADYDPLDKHVAAEEALAIGTELNEPTVIATALRNLGLLQCIQGNFLEARTHLQESLEIWRAVGASGQLGMAHTLVFLGDAVLSQGDLDTARLQ